VSNDIIIRAIVKSQVAWGKVNLGEGKDIPYSLPLPKETIRARNGLICYICRVTCFSIYLLSLGQTAHDSRW